MKYRELKDEELVGRRDFNTANVIDYIDGDKQSESTYEYGVSTLVSNKARVYKGGSWADRAYWVISW